MSIFNDRQESSIPEMLGNILPSVITLDFQSTSYKLVVYFRHIKITETALAGSFESAELTEFSDFLEGSINKFQNNIDRPECPAKNCNYSSLARYPYKKHMADNIAQ